MTMHDDRCCSGAAMIGTRRRFLTLAGLGGGAALLGLAPGRARAAGDVDAVVLSCMDYRLMDDVGVYMNKRGLKDNYDHLILAGASLGAVTAKYPDWGRTFRDHLGLAIKLHHIKRVIVIDHRDCGAYRLILGKDLKGDDEKKAHAIELHQLAQQIHTAHPALATETYLMDLDGSVAAIA
jgi:carbonic anhydrase